MFTTCLEYPSVCTFEILFAVVLTAAWNAFSPETPMDNPKNVDAMHSPCFLKPAMR